MAKKLNEIQEEGNEELKKNETQRIVREKNVKRPNMDVEDLKVLNNGFVSIQWILSSNKNERALSACLLLVRNES